MSFEEFIDQGPIIGAIFGTVLLGLLGAWRLTGDPIVATVAVAWVIGAVALLLVTKLYSMLR